MNIRRICEKDLERLTDLERECFSVPWSAESLRMLLQDNFIAFCAEDDDGTVQAYAGMMYVLDEGQIVNVATAKAARRRGLAEQLLRRLLEQARQQGITFLSLEVRQGNLPAQELYRKLGFSFAGVRPNYYVKPRENALIMIRSLLD